MNNILGGNAKFTTIQLPEGGSRQFYHRGSPADVGVIEQMFNEQQYSLQHLRREKELNSTFKALLSGNKKPLIVDAGANIGASVVWFASEFPGSHIVAFEPDPENYELLQANTSGLDVDLHKAAVGSVDGNVSIVDPGEGHWGYRTVIDENGSYKLVSLSQLIQNKLRLGYAPFLIKIDIEGGEDNLFKEATDWVEQFTILIIELHDWLLPKQGTSRNFIKCIANYDRDFVHIGENIFSIRNS
jgi:FkbM family methyltransferase